MTAVQSEFEVDKKTSRDKTLHAIRDNLAAPRVAVMQVLGFHLQQGSTHREITDPEPLNIQFPKNPRICLKQVSDNPAEWLPIVGWCRHEGEQGWRGVRPALDMHKVCSERPARVLNALSAEMARFFLEPKGHEKSKHWTKEHDRARYRKNRGCPSFGCHKCIH